MNDYRDIIAKIQESLPDYLQLNGIDPGKKFNCLHPDHEDKNPSAGVIPSKEIHRVKCFSCGRSYDIFDVANFLKGYPINGAGFITETIPNLIKELGLDIDISALNLGSISGEKRNAQKLMAEVAHIALRNYKSSPNKAVKAELKRRKWGADTIDQFEIGQSYDISTVLEEIKSSGFYNKDLIDLGLINPEGNSIFLNKTPMVFFPFHDKSFNVIGFSLRAIDDDAPQKYMNCRNSIIYSKSSYLFGVGHFDWKLKKAYLMEGYTDVITLYDNGVKNALAYCSAEFSAEQIGVFHDNGNVKDIVFCLDCDIPSIDGVMKNIKKNYESLVPFNIKIKIPNFGDPDEFIREKGIEEFLALPEIDFFTFYIKSSLKRGRDPKEISDECIELLLIHTSETAAEIKLNEIALAFDGVLSRDSIKSEYVKLKNDKTRKIESQVNYLKNNLIKKISNNEITTVDFIDQIGLVSKKLETLYETKVADSGLSSIAILERIITQEERELTRTNGVEAYKFNLFREFQDHVDGNWRDNALLCIGGSPNTGKTTLLCNMAIDLINSNPDVCIIMDSIDDEAELIFTRLISIISSSAFGPIELNAFRNPNKFMNKYNDLMEAHSYGYEKLKTLVKDGRLKIYDSRHGKNVNTIRSLMISHKNTSDRQGIFMLDNFHKLEGSERSEIEKNSSDIKDLSQEFSIPVWTTMEYKKFDRPREPNNNDLKESGKMEYDAKLVLHLHNDVHIFKEKSKAFYLNESTRSIYPIIKAIFGKNKLNSYKGNDYFVMNNECGLYSPISFRDVETLTETNVTYGDAVMSLHFTDGVDRKIIKDGVSNPEPSINDATF